MAYVRPRPTLSSIVIKGGADSPSSDEYVFRHVDLDLIMNDPDVRSNLLDAVARSFRELGIESFGGGDDKHPLSIEIRDEDIDKVVDLEIELEAGELLDEVYCRTYLTEFYGFAPRRFELTGILWIDGFAVVGQWGRER